MRTPARRILISMICALALVVVFSALALVPYLGFFNYPLIPGIAGAGAIFANGPGPDHVLRMTIAAAFLNFVLYSVLFFFIFAPRERRRRRTYTA